VFGGAGERSGGTGSPQAASETGGGMKGGEEKSGDNPQGGKHKNPGMLEIKSCQLSPHYATRKSAIKPHMAGAARLSKRPSLGSPS
jgi:hypothetical protein